MIYERFKEEQGYSRTEIERKKEALDQVLIPFTEQEHRQNLTLAGFTAIDTLMKWNNFTTLIAQKEPKA
jgi:tRNA (cmo5U34)-methyltransferase